MARKIKRLLDRWDSPDIDQLMQQNSEAWTEELAWWRRVGLETETLLSVLENTYVERRRHEAQLKDRLTRESTRQIRWVQKAWKDAVPLVHFLKTERAPDHDGSHELLFGNLGERIEQAVQSYIDARLPRPILRGRPGDLWLYRCVSFLAIHLMSDHFAESRFGRGVRQSEKSTIRAIERVLKLAGHGEVVTKEKIRHVIRRLRPVMRETRKRGPSHQERALRVRNRQEG